MIKRLSQYWTSGNAFVNKHLFFAIAAVFLYSLIYSKFLLSVSMIGWFLLSFFNISVSKSSFTIKPAQDLSQSLVAYFKAPEFWAFNLVFLVILISGINSEDASYWLHHLQLKLPFLILPFVFFKARFINQKWANALHYTFIFISILAMIHILFSYAMDFEAINKRISMGKHFPTPVHHVSLSLMLSFATISAVILWRNDTFYPALRKYMGACAVLLFVFLHVLAVRSGLATCYLALIAYLLYEVFTQKNYRFGLIILIIGFIAPFLAYKAIPSFKNKISYSMFDWSKWKKGNAVNYSDGGRILSYQLGIELFESSPWLGTGIGDIKDLSHKWYLDNVDGYSGKLNYPHNQILFLLAACGIIGTVLYLFALLFPFFSEQLFTNPFALALYTIIFASFLVESTLEHSYTIGFFLFFALIALHSRR